MNKMNEVEVEVDLKKFIEDNNFNYKSSKLILKSINTVYGLDIDFLSKEVFDNPTKKTRKFLSKILINKTPDVQVLHLLKILSKNLKLNKDLILNHYIFLKRTNQLGSLTIEFIKDLLNIYPEDRVIKILLNDEMFLLQDVIYMLKKIKLEKDLSFLSKKPKDLNSLHKELTRMIIKLKEKNYDLCQREDILKLEGHKFDSLCIKVPLTHYDLIDLGEDLSFCIGNGYYSKEVKEGRYSVVAIYQDNKPIYGIQFNRYAISQAKGFDNQNIPPEILTKIQQIIISEPKIPSDFLAILDSSWIKGFKYNNNDLYIMMNDNTYIYYDVEKEIYEELLASGRKGNFVNTYIKGCYKSAKVN